VEETVSDEAGNSGAIPLGVSGRPVPPDPSGADAPQDHAFANDMVELRLPAAGAYLSVLRTATAGLAARLDFTLDEIEDLRIAVDEACALLIPDAAEGADLTCLFSLTPDALSVTVQVPSRTGRVPQRNTFAWTVLTALAGEVDAYTDDHHQVAVTLLKRRGGRS
jgi:serine/threonine-protein kinase RsbW